MTSSTPGNPGTPGSTGAPGSTGTVETARFAQELANLRFVRVQNDIAVFRVPGTDYELHLVCRDPINTPPGRRVQGTIHARALRMHQSDTGGRFIEPVYGPPRIVQGSVIEADAQNNRLLMDLAVPVWVTLDPAQSAAKIPPGAMLNFYVESGTRFEPVAPAAGEND